MTALLRLPILTCIVALSIASAGCQQVAGPGDDGPSLLTSRIGVIQTHGSADEVAMSREAYRERVQARREFRAELRGLIYSSLSPEAMERRLIELLETSPYAADSVNHQMAAAMMLKGHLLHRAERGEASARTYAAIERQTRHLAQYRSPDVETVSRSLIALEGHVPETTRAALAEATLRTVDARRQADTCDGCDVEPAATSSAPIRAAVQEAASNQSRAENVLRALARQQRVQL